MVKRFTIGVVAATALVASAFMAHDPTPNAALAASVDGKAVYGSNCASCHQADGKGLANTFPPLAKNPHVTGDPKAVIHTLLAGKAGKLTVAGKTYDGAMPAWKGQLSNAEIAAVITYIRSSWGNKASAVTEKQVAAGK